MGRVPAKMEDLARGLSMGSFAAHGSDYFTGKRDSAHHNLSGWGMPQPWEEQAGCKDTPIEWWFGDERPWGDKGPLRTREQTQQAKAICARCPVLDECRQWAMESGLPYGFLAAMTEAERRQLAVQDQTAWQQFWRQQDKAMGRRQRNKTHCKHGHEYTPENTYTSGGKRFCIACRNIRNKQYQLRKRKELGDWLWVERRRENGHLTG